MALRILGVALIVGEKGVALKVGEIAPQISPVCTRLAMAEKIIYAQKVRVIMSSSEVINFSSELYHFQCT